MSLFASTYERLGKVPDRALAIAAPRIEAKLKSDATSRAGNVPPGISAHVEGDAVVVTGPDWVMDRVAKFNEMPSWVAILAEATREAAGST